jgi:tetrahydromethanopterin S-methyltransferase subunit B
MSLTITMDAPQVDEYFRRLADGAAQAVRPAAQAGAQVLYDKVRDNVDRIKTVSGNLKNSIYQVYSKSLSVDGRRAVYEISWNYKKAPHGVLVEFGHMVRYVYFLDAKGVWRPKVRPERQGEPPPKRRASRAVKDAYYVPLAAPFKTTPQPFIRNAIPSFPDARAAMVASLMRAMNDRLEGR